MRLKKRIKRALARFLEKELLEEIGYRHNYKPIPDYQAKIKHLEFDLMMCEGVISIEEVTNPYKYEEALNRVKRELLREAEKRIQVETFDLTSPEYQFRRAIKMKLYLPRI